MGGEPTRIVFGQATSRNLRIASRRISLVVCSALARESIAARNSGSTRIGTRSARPDPTRVDPDAGSSVRSWHVVLVGGTGRESRGARGMAWITG